jgi:hypothetical protein
MSHGGKPIGSGSFGCVFSPSLRCYDDTDAEQRDDMISKLMLTEKANAEYNELTRFSKIIKQIPNYEKHFIVDVEKCRPAKLTKEDMVNFDKKCAAAFKRYDITANRVNNVGFLSQMRILTMRNGGPDIGEYMRLTTGANVRERLVNLMAAMKAVINRAVLPMNKLGLYHCDLKGANMLMDAANNMVLIDWGLSGTVTPAQREKMKSTSALTVYNNTASVNRRRPPMFNVPFSTVLINPNFLFKYALWLADFQKNKEVVLAESWKATGPDQLTGKKGERFAIIDDDSTKPWATVKNAKGVVGQLPAAALVYETDERRLRRFVEKEVFACLKETGPGHLKFIDRLTAGISKLERPAPPPGLAQQRDYFVDYIYHAVKNHTDLAKRTFDFGGYVEAFYHNVDLWGTLMCLVEVINYSSDLKKHVPNSQEVLQKIIKILMNHCWRRFDTPKISVAAVNADLDALVKLLGGVVAPKKQTKKTTKKSQRLVIVSEKELAAEDLVVALKRRCPNGTRRDPKTRKCVPKAAQPAAKGPPPAREPALKLKRCPNGTRRDPKTKKCVPKAKLKRCPNGTRRNPKTKKCEPK